MNKKTLFITVSGVAVIALSYFAVFKKKNLTNSIATFTEEAIANPDEFIKIANTKTDRILELAEQVKFNVTLNGRIQRALSWDDFPGLAEAVSKIYPDGNQLLQVSVGETAMLVTRKTSFNTTGYFNLNAVRYTQWETTAGKVWVLVESPEAQAQHKEWEQLKTELKELSLQYIEKKLPEYQAQAAETKKTTQSNLSENTIAGLMFSKDLGKKTGPESNFFVYDFVKNLALCNTQKEYKLNAKSWQLEFEKVFKDHSKDIALKKVSCADGGPYTSNGRVYSFEKCMCGAMEEDPFLTLDKKSQLKFTQLIAPQERQPASK